MFYLRKKRIFSLKRKGGTQFKSNSALWPMHKKKEIIFGINHNDVFKRNVRKIKGNHILVTVIYCLI